MQITSWSIRRHLFHEKIITLSEFKFVYMTCIITITSPEGIVLGADKRISRQLETGKWEFQDRVKTYGFLKHNVAASYWGKATLPFEGQEVYVDDFLALFEKHFVEPTDDVNTISEKISSYLGALQPKIAARTGIHFSGYCREKDKIYPVLRHVFHESWNPPGEFVNEYSNKEAFDFDGNKMVYDYDPWIAVFNGDPFVPRAFFNFFGSTPFGLDRYIIIDLLNLKKCLGLARLIVCTASEIIKYTYQTEGIFAKDPQVVAGVSLATITKEKGFEWVEP